MLARGNATHKLNTSREHQSQQRAMLSVQVHTIDLYEGVDGQEEVSDWRSNCTGNDAWLYGQRGDDWWTGPKPSTERPYQAMP